MILVTEPADSNPLTTDWQRFLYRTTIQGGGFILFLLTNMNNALAPSVVKGSRLEVNSSFYLASNDESIDDPPGGFVNRTHYYIYAVPQESSAIFQYFTDVPEFDPAKGGWFNGMMRAIARLYYTDGKFLNKTMLDEGGGGMGTNWTEFPSSADRVLVASGVVNQIINYQAEPGIYEIELLGGKGGDGGQGGTGGTSMYIWTGGNTPYSGSQGKNGETGKAATIPITSKFIVNQLTNITIVLGRNGNKGSIGGNGHVGAGTGTGNKVGEGGGGGGGGQGGFPTLVIVPGIGIFESIGGYGGDGGTGGESGLISANVGNNSGGKGGEGSPPAINGRIGNSGIFTDLPNTSEATGLGGDGGSGIATTSDGYARVYKVA